MCRAAPRSLWLRAVVCWSRQAGCLVALALSSACSVYSSDLVGDAAALTVSSGGSDGAGAGRGGDVAGNSNAVGGKAGVDTIAAGGDSDAVTAAGSDGAVRQPSAGAGGASTGGAAATGGTTPSTDGGGIGGNSATSGGAGTGGGPVTVAGDLLDGFEDEDLTLEQTDGRGGVWYLFDDGTVGKTGPVPLSCTALTNAPAALGMYAMHITASGFTDFGSGLGVDLRAGKKVYDGSKFTGIRFWAKVGEGKNTRHRVQIADATTDEAGGKCNPAVTAVDGEKCDDHFGFNATFTSSWAQYVIRFDQLSQIGWGKPAPALDKSALYGLQVTAKAKLDVDLWLDQIELF